MIDLIVLNALVCWIRTLSGGIHVFLSHACFGSSPHVLLRVRIDGSDGVSGPCVDVYIR